jgi:CO/xanthine dehydrogenase Mo-binding subunit
MAAFRRYVGIDYSGAQKLDEKHRFLALDIDLITDMGAYLSQFAPYIPYLGAGLSPGVYDIPACHVRVRALYTNTVPVDAYRGAGRPEEPRGRLWLNDGSCMKICFVAATGNC